MLTGRFNALFTRLVTSFERYQDTPRGPETVGDIAAARIELDIARDAIATERTRIMSRGTQRFTPQRTAVSQDDLARLRAFGSGFVSG